jgi:hypothetical protein
MIQNVSTENSFRHYMHNYLLVQFGGAKADRFLG